MILKRYLMILVKSLLRLYEMKKNVKQVNTDTAYLSKNVRFSNLINQPLTHISQHANRWYKLTGKAPRRLFMSQYEIC